MNGPYRDPTAKELHDYIKKLEAERDEYKRRAEAAESDRDRLEVTIGSLVRAQYKNSGKITDLRRENAKIRKLLNRWAAKHIPIEDGCTCRECETNRFLQTTEAKTGQQIWPPVVDSANDSRETEAETCRWENCGHGWVSDCGQHYGPSRKVQPKRDIYCSHCARHIEIVSEEV